MRYYGQGKCRPSGGVESPERGGHNGILLYVTSLALVAAAAIFSFILWFYPARYESVIAAYSRENGLSPALVAAVANTESGFDPAARSNRGAVGIMQIMPSTAKWTAEYLMGESYAGDGRLADPDYNIRLGTRYLRYLFDRFGDETAALAAYNAGETAVKGWILGGALTAENIPYRETRRYIRKVARAKRVYAFRFARR